MLRFAVILCLCATAIAGVFTYQAWHWLSSPFDVPESSRDITIAPGDNLHLLSRRMHDRGLIRWPLVWVGYAKLMGVTQINVGEYALAESESPLSILSRVQSGDVVQHSITFIEGLTVRDYLSSLRAHKKVNKVLPQQPSIADWHKYGFEFDHPEGWFFPDTYYFTRGDSDIAILKRAYRKMKSLLEQEWRDRDLSTPYTGPYQALIMASIVEKETGAAFERKDIAGVFVRRLHAKMRLQTDPTVIYGMGDAYHGNITRADLRRPTPYNTYVIKGLPPTPIAMPGQASVHAALNPAEGDSMYFVARGDGTHVFSRTLAEHQKAVNAFQKRRRSDYRSAPPPAGATQDE